ncbi:shikimate 5-dehydrogenase [Corynebacterium kutscheri]|uniref:shikimate dehydrogenase (NADP(+)) n=1 Tax=Corynebacterium kutscheri TaxID=35755 RepID=A0A0F6TDK0_9CORY|nr:shikimate dehydrogenase [Corynebacterium kutscheri]AKE41321.1 shikimate-5-dehydrogenase, fungal AROM-type [Corynebacterium kutscheri]VEH08597.1 shikimate 5-dehydrogenase [Corynebacterium kutscheri]VEH09643.1 shikimate 5-dehydrogenase [Corynebacterium kutscheri]VEH79726.1 shikimate 5-dehydrogenase [Corynebacterium kutscheri]
MTEIFCAAVLGSPIEHSLSPVLHNAGYQALGLPFSYTRIEATAQTLPNIVTQADQQFRGFSVTMPAKFAALAYANTVSNRAQLIGSANTLVRTDTGWYADNTDGEGLIGAINELAIPHLGVGSAVIIGSGGTARSAIWALAQTGFSNLWVINRTDRRQELQSLCDQLGITLNYRTFRELKPKELADIVTYAQLLISTVPSEVISQYLDVLARTNLIDVIYDPWPTPLVEKARERGFSACGGYVMLAHQAMSQFEQFTQHPAPRKHMRAALEDALGIVD